MKINNQKRLENTRKSETDWALEILLENQQPMFYLDLIKIVGEKIKKDLTESQIISIYTRLNMDNRLTYMGEGLWFFDNNKLNWED